MHKFQLISRKKRKVKNKKKYDIIKFVNAIVRQLIDVRNSKETSRNEVPEQSQMIYHNKRNKR